MITMKRNLPVYQVILFHVNTKIMAIYKPVKDIFDLGFSGHARMVETLETLQEKFA